MKDLYRKLGLNSDCSLNEIKAALKNRSSSLKREEIADIEYVLLQSTKRRKYDHVHKTAQCITDLREQINIRETSGHNRAGLSGFVARKRQASGNSNQSIRETNVGTSGPNENFGCIVIVVLCIGLVIWGVGSAIRKEKTPEIPTQRVPDYSVTPRSSGPSYEAYPEIEAGRLALPRTGVMLRYDRSRGLAPLEIRTRQGSGNYYLKISRIIGDRLILSLTAFIRDGETLNTTMPVGNYEIRYANGENWYGPTRRFGKNTSYAKADDVFSFRETSRGYTGFTVELYRQINGNLDTDPLTEDEF